MMKYEEIILNGNEGLIPSESVFKGVHFDGENFKLEVINSPLPPADLFEFVLIGDVELHQLTKLNGYKLLDEVYVSEWDTWTYIFYKKVAHFGVGDVGELKLYKKEELQ